MLGMSPKLLKIEIFKINNNYYCGLRKHVGNLNYRVAAFFVKQKNLEEQKII